MGTATIPHQVYCDFVEGFGGVEMVDITDEYETLRAYKSSWEVEQIQKATDLCDLSYDKMMGKLNREPMNLKLQQPVKLSAELMVQQALRIQQLLVPVNAPKQ